VYATGDITATSNGNKKHAIAGGITGSSGEDAAGGGVIYAYATGDIKAKATGMGEGFGDDKAMVGAGGIAGGNRGAPIRYTVALNSGVSASASDAANYKRRSFRITSAPGGVVTTNGAANYGDENLTAVGNSAEETPGTDKGNNQQDGTDVTTGDQSSETWWKTKGFSGADWAKVWEWDAVTSKPKLR
jgi:hypothetical protein